MSHDHRSEPSSVQAPSAPGLFLGFALFEVQDPVAAAVDGDNIPDGPAKWAVKLEYLLNSPKGFDVFLAYMTSIHCEENVLFYRDNQALKNSANDQVAVC